MILFKKTTKNLYSTYRQALNDLYLKAFTKGVSAQHITSKEAKSYLDELFTNGYGVFGFVEQKLVAALLVTPPSFDQERPLQIQKKYSDQNSEYIAEVLVDENFRGQGLGKALMQANRLAGHR